LTCTSKQHAIVNNQLNIVTCPRYPDKFIHTRHVVAPFVLLWVVIVTLPYLASESMQPVPGARRNLVASITARDPSARLSSHAVVA